ncbi:MAG TPA: DUF3095 domain-containing protein [Casimicrobiaceae bacterium]|nr:DUF3095 domain-containing protein [Casimicrobiaceae bacterium]
MQADADYYSHLPIFDGFASVMDPARYQPLPDGWLLGLTDVVSSTKAIEEGRYKAVNTAGASVIAAVSNALGGRKFPFVFGGDGASFAVSGEDEALARAALAATAAWTRDDLGLELRIALVPVSAVKERGLNVSVARFAPSKNVSYAMFSGGGLAWADGAMKRGGFAVPPAPPGTRPDLSGLSCRWNDIPASHGLILSLVVAPVTNGDPAFRKLVEELLAELENSSEVARPVPENAPGVGWPPPGLDLEARASRKSGERLFMRRLRVSAGTLLAFMIMRLGIRVGGFDPAVYRREVVENSDFRKYDDNLRMTLDCTPALADRIEQRLTNAEVDKVARFGLHRQPSAIMTCIVPSISESTHVHFVDGAAGGYALAARRLKLNYA